MSKQIVLNSLVLLRYYYLTFTFTSCSGEFSFLYKLDSIANVTRGIQPRSHSHRSKKLLHGAGIDYSNVLQTGLLAGIIILLLN